MRNGLPQNSKPTLDELAADRKLILDYMSSRGQSPEFRSLKLGSVRCEEMLENNSKMTNILKPREPVPEPEPEHEHQQTRGYGYAR
jgi:hypothetical protein